VDRFTSNQDKNDSWSILRNEIVGYISPAEMLRFCDIDICLSVCLSHNLHAFRSVNIGVW